MKLTLGPTGIIEPVNGQPHRIWQGQTDKGVPVKAWIITVQPQTHDAEALADFERELREVKAERRLVSMDMRVVI